MLAKDKKINKSSEESSSTFGVVKDPKLPVIESGYRTELPKVDLVTENS